MRQAVVQKTGSVRIEIPENANTSNGYIYVPGTTIFTFLNTDSSFAVLDSVPQGVIPSIFYSSTISTDATVLRYGIAVLPEI